MSTTRLTFLVLLAACALDAVEPMPGGCNIVWERRTNDVSYSVWHTIPPGTNWAWIANITETSFFWSNAVPPGTLFGVSAIVRDPVTGLYVEDVGVAHWPPAFDAGPTNGLTLRLLNTNRVVQLLGSADGNAWQTLAYITNAVPARLTQSRKAMLLRASTNLPPLPE